MARLISAQPYRCGNQIGETRHVLGRAAPLQGTADLLAIRGRQLGDELIERNPACANAGFGVLSRFVERIGIAGILHVHDDVLSALRRTGADR